MDDFEKLLQSLALDEDGIHRQWLSLSSALPLLVAAVLGFGILGVYIASSRRENRDRNLYTVIPVLTILMAVIMRIEGAQIVLFFGIFGILSIVRFRSDLTDQKGITFILFTVIIGVLVGVGNYFLAILAFGTVTGAIFLGRVLFVKHSHYRFILRIPGDFGSQKQSFEAWLGSQRLEFRLLEFSQDAGFSSKIQAWETRRRLEYEVIIKQDSDLMERLELLNPQLQEKGWELEVKRSGEGG